MRSDELGQNLRDCGSVVVCDDGGVGGHVKSDESEVVIEVEKKWNRYKAEKYLGNLALWVLKIQGDLRIQHDAPLFGQSRPACDIGFHVCAKGFGCHG